MVRKRDIHNAGLDEPQLNNHAKSDRYGETLQNEFRLTCHLPH